MNKYFAFYASLLLGQLLFLGLQVLAQTPAVPVDECDTESTESDDRLEQEETELQHSLEMAMNDSLSSLNGTGIPAQLYIYSEPIPLTKFKQLAHILEIKTPVAKAFFANLDAADTNRDGHLGVEEYMALFAKLGIRDRDEGGGAPSKSDGLGQVKLGMGIGRKRKRRSADLF